MLSPAECRQHAIECLEMADRTVPPDRSGFLELAEVWFKLAMEAAEIDRRPAASTRLH
jgi:hypothetical protein